MASYIMLQRSRRLIAASVNLDYFSSVALKSNESRKLGVTAVTRLSMSPNDAKSSKACLSLFAILGITAATLFYYNRKKMLDISRTKSGFNFLAEAAKKAIPGVVYVESTQMREGIYEGNLKTLEINKVNGSGFIVDERGYILTNAHVIANTSGVTVQHTEETFSATVIGVNEVADLALLELEARCKQKFPALKFGKSSELQPGEWVVALGSPLSLKNTITSGIISTVGRTSKELASICVKRDGWDMEYIQTDAPITEGNSGGPLVNLNGEVVGINTMTAFPGISFAVPSQVAEEFVNKVLKTSHKEKPKEYRIGIFIMSLSPQVLDFIWHSLLDLPADIQKGVFIITVWPGSPASEAGLQMNDIIVKVDKTPITSTGQIYDMVQKGKPLSIEVIRGQQKLKIIVTPEPII